MARRAFLRVVLGSCLGLAPEAVRYTSAPGKPAVPGAPFDWSLSHSGELALLAVAHGGVVGADLEALRPLDGIDALAAFACSPAERRALRRMPAQRRADAFLRLWTCKEAAAKATGVGLAGLQTPDPRLHVRALAGIDGYVAALASRAVSAPGRAPGAGSGQAEGSRVARAVAEFCGMPIHVVAEEAP